MRKVSLKAKIVLGVLLVLAVVYLAVKLDNVYQKNRAELPPVLENSP